MRAIIETSEQFVINYVQTNGLTIFGELSDTVLFGQNLISVCQRCNFQISFESIKNGQIIYIPGLKDIIYEWYFFQKYYDEKIIGYVITISEKNKQSSYDLVKIKQPPSNQALKKFNSQFASYSVDDKTLLSNDAKIIRDYYINIIAGMPGNVYWKDYNGVYLGCNNNALNYFGLQHSRQLIGKTDYDMFEPEIARQVVEMDRRVIETGESIFIEEASYQKDGKTYLTQKVPLKHEDGEVTGVLGISIDVTEKKHLEKELQAALKEKIMIAEALGGMIAHEIKTPLAAMGMTSNRLNDALPSLLKAYDLALKANIFSEKINPKLLKYIASSPQRIASIVAQSNLMIEILLKNIKEVDEYPPDFGIYSIAECVDSLLSEYPFSETEKSISIDWVNKSDFLFQGSRLLMKHTLLNLLKNALYFVLAANKGEISIWLEADIKENKLYFKDTGQGIKKEHLDQLFKKFISHRKHGTGLGLALCKDVMKKINGRIECKSKEGEYTQFILIFPTIEAKS